jgi:hypothetical protein
VIVACDTVPAGAIAGDSVGGAAVVAGAVEVVEGRLLEPELQATSVASTRSPIERERTSAR